MALKTYSRQRKHSQPVYEPTAKRRRLSSPDAPSFSSDAPKSDNTPVEPSSPPLQPQSHQNFTELVIPSSTPPSSPPAPIRSSPEPILLKRRPTFSFLARKTTKTSSSAAVNKPPPAATSPLQPRSTNNVSSRQTKLPTTSSTAKKQTRLTQLRLDLGTAPVQKTCSTCGMAYVPSNAEDAALHKAFHAQNVGGVELGRSFVRGVSAAQRVWEGHEGDCVVVVSRRDGAAAKNRVARVMEVVRAELGAVEIAEAELWGQVEVEAAAAPPPTSTPTVALEARRRKSMDLLRAEEKGESADPKSTMPLASKKTPKTSTSTPFRPPAVATADRYKAYLYIRGTKCVGFCLAERILSAYRHCDVNSTSAASTSTSTKPEPTPSSSISNVTPTGKANAHAAKATATPSSSSSLSSSSRLAPPAKITSSADTSPSVAPTPSPIPAHFGISRIWTSSSYRRSGIGSTLLSAVAKSFVYGSTVDRDAVAFSQPTQMGARLARRWVGGENRNKGDGEGTYLVYW